MLSFSSLVTSRGEAVKLLSIQMGVSLLLKMADWEAVVQSPIAPILDSVMWITVAPRPVVIPQQLQGIVDGLEDSDPDALYREVLQKCLTNLGKLHGGLLVHTWTKPKITSLDIGLSIYDP